VNYAIVTELLREELGYQYLVVTDDMEMGAIARHYKIEDAAVKAFMAGEDMLLICADSDKIRRGYRSLLSAAKDGRVPQSRIQASLRRIEATKSITAPPDPLDPDRFHALADEINDLNSKLNYVYGGTIK
jgi:beta-glucosidase-like glycosyl hydrolase